MARQTSTHVKREGSNRQQSPSSGSDGPSTSNSLPRKVYSCEGCRKRKTKCDHLRPCSGCSMRGIECRYRGQPPIAPIRPVLQKQRNTSRQNKNIAEQQELAALRRVAIHLAKRLNLREEDVDAMVATQREDPSSCSSACPTPDLSISPSIPIASPETPVDASPALFADAFAFPAQPMMLPPSFAHPDFNATNAYYHGLQQSSMANQLQTKSREQYFDPNQQNFAPFGADSVLPESALSMYFDGSNTCAVNTSLQQTTFSSQRGWLQPQWQGHPFPQ